MSGEADRINRASAAALVGRAMGRPVHEVECSSCGRQPESAAELAAWLTITPGVAPYHAPASFLACSTDCGVEIVNRVTDGR